MCKFRTLEKNEIEVRVAQTTQKQDGSYKVSLLLYQDARAAMKLLDEVYGTHWTRSQQMIGENLYCTISIYDEELGQWVSRQDVGTESNTDPEKGQASDAFKRAAVNFGIGRELYTAPKIDVDLKDKEYFIGQNGKPKVWMTYKVSHIHYNAQREIDELEIVNKWGKPVFSMGDNDLPEADVTPMPNMGTTRPTSQSASANFPNPNKELTEAMPTMWKSAIGHAAMGESLDQVNTLLSAKGYFLSRASWDRIQSSF